MKLQSNRRLALLGGALLVGFAVLSLTAFRQTLTPYVSFPEARAAQRTVQIAGELEKGTSGYDTTEQSLLFTLRDPKSKETVRVRYHGLRPANFEDALSIVAIGRFDSTTHEMRAEKLLVKCPSKYQGVETKTYG